MVTSEEKIKAIHGVIEKNGECAFKSQYEGITIYFYCCPANNPWKKDKVVIVFPRTISGNFEICTISKEQYDKLYDYYAEFEKIDSDNLDLRNRITLQVNNVDLLSEKFYDGLRNTLIVNTELTNKGHNEKKEEYEYTCKIAKEVFESFQLKLKKLPAYCICDGNQYYSGQKYITVFFETNEDLAKCLSDGTTRKLNNYFIKLAKKIDKNDLIKNNYEYLHFDSDENLEKKFKGSLHRYFS